MSLSDQAQDAGSEATTSDNETANMDTSTERGRSGGLNTSLAVSRKRSLNQDHGYAKNVENMCTSIVKNIAYDNNGKNNSPVFKIARTVTNPQKTVINMSNKFSVLNEELLNDESAQQALATDNKGNNQRKEKVFKKIKTPDVRPIMAKLGKDERTILKKLTTEDQCKFTVAPAGEFTRIFPKTPDAYIAISKKLDEYEVQHILFPERVNSEALKAVIRGLPLDTPPEEIEEELKENGFEVLKVVRMINYRTKKPMPLFQVFLKVSDLAKKIFEVKNIFYYHVMIEPYVQVKRTIQCHNCQFYHHKQDNCHMRPRCVKCGASGHESRACPKSIDGQVKAEDVQCANCSGQHTASFRGCPKWPENRKKLLEARRVHPQISFASITATRPHKNPQPDPQTTGLQELSTLQSIMDEIAKQLQVDSLADLIFKYNDLLTKIKNCTTLQEKQLLFVKFLSSSNPTAP